MSNSDSFIDEVADEVRRDKLYGYLRRYGWIAVLCVLALVGAAAWNEYSSAQDRATAEATGDAILAALQEDAPEARAEAIATVSADGDAAAVIALLQAATQEEAGDATAAAATLENLAADPAAPAIYRDLAAFKAAMLPTGDVDARLAALEALAMPGQPFRLLAMEQMAYISLDAGDTESAIAMLRSLVEDAAVSRSLQDRVQTLMVALGEPLPEAATQ